MHPARSTEAIFTELRALGGKSLAIEVNGYGDSGDIESVTVANMPWPVGKSKPEGCTEIQLTPGLEDEVGNWAWDKVYSHHPGFEINDGGYCYIVASLETGEIDYDFHINVMTTEPHPWTEHVDMDLPDPPEEHAQ